MGRQTECWKQKKEEKARWRQEMSHRFSPTRTKQKTVERYFAIKVDQEEGDGGRRCDRASGPVWLDGQIGFSIFGNAQQWKFAQKHSNCPNGGSQLRQLRKKPYKYGQICLNFYQNGEISPNLITLLSEREWEMEWTDWSVSALVCLGVRVGTCVTEFFWCSGWNNLLPSHPVFALMSLNANYV